MNDKDEEQPTRTAVEDENGSTRVENERELTSWGQTTRETSENDTVQTGEYGKATTEEPSIFY